jgi:anaerobic magnesium-protoporphyrin IX monomethyl ester cyclase
MSARIALLSVNAGVKGSNSHWPHYGLTLLATVLKQAGYEARVFDQSFLDEPDEAFVERVRAFAPAVAGFSLYTTHISRGLKVAGLLRDRLPGCRFIAGGPHASLYTADVRATGAFQAVVQGEAEGVVVATVERVLAGEAPGIVVAPPTDPAAIPMADFTTAPGSERMEWLPIQLSRGCPFNCSFCEVKHIASRRIRYRDVGEGLHEIERNLAALPRVHSVRIVDDCPTLDLPRFKGFLREYRARGLRGRISIDNMRADTVDAELVDLLKQCRTPYICIAAESGNPAVFTQIDKGETLDDIRRAGRLVKERGIPLYMCFVIGLPGSTFEAEMDSLRLAQSLKPDLIYWNLFLPHRGTRARDWFAEHGTIFDEADKFSVPAYDLTFTPPATETPEFPRAERIRAYLTCVLETVSFVFTPVALARAVRLAIRYRLGRSLLVMLLGIPGKFLVYAGLMLGRVRAAAGNNHGAAKRAMASSSPRARS